jgi:hypothetical protein
MRLTGANLGREGIDTPTEPPFSLDVPAHRDPPMMSRSVDPADHNRAVTPIPSNDCSDKSSGRSVPPIGSLADSKIFLAALMTGAQGK